MKKYLLGIIAIVMAVGLSAFTTEKKRSLKSPTTHWFLLSASRTIGSGNSFINSEVSYSGTSYPGPCTGTGKYCNVEFNSNQVIDLGGGNVTLNGTQSSISNDEKQ